MDASTYFKEVQSMKQLDDAQLLELLAEFIEEDTKRFDDFVEFVGVE